MYNQFSMLPNMPAFMQPAAQAVAPTATVTTTTTGQVPAGVNAMNQVVDQNGSVITDANGNAVTVPAATTGAATTGATTTAVDPNGNLVTVPAATTTTPTVSTMGMPTKNLGAMLTSLAISALVIGGAAAVGSFYGARRALEDRGVARMRSSRSSRRASRAAD